MIFDNIENILVLLTQIVLLDRSYFSPLFCEKKIYFLLKLYCLKKFGGDDKNARYNDTGR